MYWYYSSSQLEHHQCPASTFPTSGNCGKLTALRCPIAVCSLLLYLIQRFIVLCKTILPHFINPIILWVVLNFTYTVLPYRAMAVLKLAVSILLVSFDSIREILWSRLYDLNCGLILETICSYLNHSDSYIAIPQADVDFIVATIGALSDNLEQVGFEPPNFRNVSAALPYKLLFHDFPPTITLTRFTLPPRLSAVPTIQFLSPKTNHE